MISYHIANWNQETKLEMNWSFFLFFLAGLKLCSADVTFKKANEDDVPVNIKAHSSCIFPFNYMNEVYSKCTKKNSNGYWCSTTKTFIRGSADWKWCKEGDEWTVIQRRIDGSVSFARTWIEYKNGFGDPNGEFWLGNDKLHELTSAAPMKIRFDLWDKDDNHRYAEYSSFSVGSESDNYRLSISGYSGNAGDSMNYHNNLKFSTRDRDNDMVPNHTNSCSQRSGYGGWWYKNCHETNLNGEYLTPGTGDNSWKGILWYQWKKKDESLKKTIIKISYK